MKTRVLKPIIVFVAFLTVASPASGQVEVILETATLGQTGLNGGEAIDNEQFLGAPFTANRRIMVDSDASGRGRLP